MTTVKLSHTTLSAWAKGNYEDAVAYYLGKGVPSTPQMELGSLKHDEWAKHIEQHKTIPDELGGGTLVDPIVEQFYGTAVPFTDDIQIYLIGRFDCVDNGIVYDWKCGQSLPSSHTNGHQLGYYQTILKANDVEVHEGRFVCFNPITKQHKVGVQYLTDKTLDAALEHIMTFGGELINYLQTQKLLKDYDPDWHKKPASQKQKDFMKVLKVDFLPDVTAGQASELINQAKEKQNA